MSSLIRTLLGVVGVGAAIVSLTTGCGVSATFVPGADAGSSSAGTGGPTGGAGTGGAGTGGGMPLDLSSDPHNCGFVGHDCQGASCAAGLCAPSTVRKGVGYFAVQGGVLFRPGGTSMYDGTIVAGMVDDPASDHVIAGALDTACLNAMNSFFVTGSYLVAVCPSKILTVAVGTGAIATITTSSVSDLVNVVGNDSRLFWFDDTFSRWAVTTPGGTPTPRASGWYFTALVATPSGLQATASPTWDGPLALYHEDNAAGSTPTFVSSLAINTSLGTLAINASTVFGAQSPAGPATACENPQLRSATLWSAPRLGGNDKTLASLPFRVGQVAASNATVVLGEECENVKNGNYTGTINVWTLPVQGGSPTMLALARAVLRGIALDGGWVYFPSGTDLVRVAVP